MRTSLECRYWLVEPKCLQLALNWVTGRFRFLRLTPCFAPKAALAWRHPPHKIRLCINRRGQSLVARGRRWGRLVTMQPNLPIFWLTPRLSVFSLKKILNLFHFWVSSGLISLVRASLSPQHFLVNASHRDDLDTLVAVFVTWGCLRVAHGRLARIDEY